MPHAESLPTPANPSGSGITYFGSSTISAPGAYVWSVFLDFDNYSWNTFTPKVECAAAQKESRPFQVDDEVQIDAHIDSPDAAPRPTKVVVSNIENPAGKEKEVGTRWRICWKAKGFPSFSLRCERVMEVEVLEPENGVERCIFRTWETMAGPLAGTVKTFVGKGLDGAFQRCADDLKKYIEGKGSEKTEGVVEEAN